MRVSVCWRATSLLLGGGYDVSPGWRADVSLGIDVGESDSTQALSRAVGGGVSHRLGGSVGLSAPLRRLKSGFTGGVNRQSGSGKIGCR